MPQRILYPEFRDQLEPTKYPFGSKSRLRNTAGTFLLEGTFLDAHLYPIGGQEKLYLSKAVITHGEITLWIGDVNNDALASGQFLLTDPPDHVRLTDAYGRPAGILVSERQRMSIFQTWGVGTHTFEIRDTEFAATCCMPTPEIGVRGILLEDGTLFPAHVWIVGEDGVVVRRETVTLPGKCGQAAREVEVIRVDIVGDPLYRRRLCDPLSLFSTPNPVRQLRIRAGDTVFTCPPNALGNFSIQMNDNLAGDTALRVRTTLDGIVFEVVGSKTASEDANA